MQDVDVMIENAMAQEWEELTDVPDEEKCMDASYEMGYAWEKISDALDFLATAAEKTEGTVAYDKIVSLLDDLDDLQTEIHIMKEKLRKGGC